MMSKLESVFTQKHHEARIHLNVFRGCCGHPNSLLMLLGEVLEAVVRYQI